MDIKQINTLIQTHKLPDNEKNKQIVFDYDNLIKIIKSANQSHGIEDSEALLDIRKQIILNIFNNCLIEDKFTVKPSMIRALVSCLSQGYEPLNDESIRSYAAVSIYINEKSILPISPNEKEGEKELRLLSKVLLSINKTEEIEDITEAFLNVNSLLKVSPGIGQVSLLKITNPEFKDISSIDPHKFLFGNFDIQLSGNKIIQKKSTI